MKKVLNMSDQTCLICDAVSETLVCFQNVLLVLEKYLDNGLLRVNTSLIVSLLV